jgi:hypothetical protein
MLTAGPPLLPRVPDVHSSRASGPDVPCGKPALAELMQVKAAAAVAASGFT